MASFAGASLVFLFTACELVIDVPAKPNSPANGIDSGRGETPRGDASVDSALPPPPPGSNPMAESGAVDVAVPMPDGATSDHIVDGGRDASLPVDAACTGPVHAWYADDDRDGYGRSSVSSDVRFACERPGEKWATVAGDCADDNALVHPDQATYFGVPYTRSDGAGSYDYDCSSFEEGDPTALLSPKSCGLLSLALCGGYGYAATSRVGVGLNEYCGSGVWSTCEANIAGILGCGATSVRRDPPFGCH